MNGFEVLRTVYDELGRVKPTLFRQPARNTVLLYSDWEEKVSAVDEYKGAKMVKNSKGDKLMLSHGVRVKVFDRGGSHLKEDERLERIILMETRSWTTEYEEDFTSFVRGCREYTNTAVIIYANAESISCSYIFSDFLLEHKEPILDDNESINAGKRSNFIGNVISIEVKENSADTIIKFLLKSISAYVKDYDSSKVMQWDYEHFN
ncbi:MAG: hypothetical protein JW791_04280 [Nanoarchaeota archaeon]|nr:hypothetical protein [Nanoarchaeota archaeon]